MKIFFLIWSILNYEVTSVENFEVFKVSLEEYFEKGASLVVDRYSFRFLYDSFRSAPKIFERMSSRVVWS